MSAGLRNRPFGARPARAGLVNRPFDGPRALSPELVLTAHWRADSGVTNSGGVSPWVDRIGGKSATEATNKPTFTAADAENGQPCVSFDGVNDKLTVASGSFSAGVTARTWFFVRRAKLQDGNYDYLTQIGAGTEDIMSSQAAGHCGVNTTQVFTPATPASREAVVEIYTVSGGCTLWRNGYKLTLAAPMAGISLAANNLILCSGGGSNFAANDIFEWGVHETRAISAAEIRGLSAYAFARYGIAPVIPRTGTLMCFGDSMTAAAAADGCHSWREQLCARLPGVSFVGTQIAGRPYSDHEGVGGDTFAAMLARLGAALAANPAPKVMLVQGGVNDASGGASGATIAASMRTFVEAAFAISPTTRYGVLDEPTSADATIAARLAAYNAAMNAQIATMAGNGIKVERLTALSLLSLSDLDVTNHPKASGHLIAVRALDPAVKGWFAAA